MASYTANQLNGAGVEELTGVYLIFFLIFITK
jgi:hypothetical protein